MIMAVQFFIGGKFGFGSWGSLEDYKEHLLHLGGLWFGRGHGVGFAEKRRGEVECSSGCSRVQVVRVRGSTKGLTWGGLY